MLVLRRKRSELVRLVIPPSTEPTLVEVMVVDVRGDKARLGFTAPRCIEIHREEVFERIDAERATEAESAELVSAQ